VVNHTRKRQEYLRIFRSTFLGTTRNAHNCKISDESRILFISEPGNDTLRAFSSEPILLENTALGYKATYFLDEFEYYRKSKTFNISGNMSFTEDLYPDISRNSDIEMRRYQTYTQSRMYFFRSLWQGNLDSLKLRIKSPDDEFLEYNQVIYSGDRSVKYLKHPVDRVESQHSDRPPSYVVFNEDDVEYDKDGHPALSSISLIYLEQDTYFDNNGYFDPAFISWQGRLSLQRIGDMLPYEYKLK